MKNIPILHYHQISDVSRARDPFGLAVSPAQFEQQMAYLHTLNYRCLPLSSAVQTLAEGGTLPHRSFAITFDDGYRDNYELAFPILQRYSFPATIFLVTDRVDSMTDWDGQDGERAFPLMDWDQVREMHRQGVSFGSHSRTHPRLDTLSREQALWEIRTSREVLEQELGATVDLFAYPYERFNRDVMRWVQEAGYRAAFGSSRLPESLFNLWRIEIFGSDTLSRFRWKTSSVWRPLVYLKARLRPLKTMVKRLVR